jgi:hypothetical protein
LALGALAASSASAASKVAFHGKSDEIHRLLGRKRWRWVEFAGYAIVFRPLSDAEREKRGAALPTLLIGRIVPVAEIARIGKEFLTGTEDGGE